MGGVSGKIVEDALSGKNAEAALKLFDAIDKDKSGVIDRKEAPPLVEALCKHMTSDPKEYRVQWLRDHPDRVFSVLERGGCNKRANFQEFLQDYTSDIMAFMKLLAECGYFRHAKANPAFTGGGITDEYLDRIKVDSDSVKAVPARDEFWNNPLERELLAACKANDLGRVKKAIAKGVDCNIRDLRDDKVETAKDGNFSGASPVYYACSHGNIEMLKALHMGHAILDELSYDGGNALHALFSHIHEAKTKEQLHGYGMCFSFLIGAHGILKMAHNNWAESKCTLETWNDSYNKPAQVCLEKKFTEDKVGRLYTLTEVEVPRVFDWIA